MTTKNQLQVLSAAIPTPTPQHAQSLSADQLDAHRQQIAFDVEVILDGYWDKHPPAQVKAGILADWADTLEDWTQEQTLYGLRKWRNENPNKRPNPGHILAILKAERGKAEYARMAPQRADLANGPSPTPDERQRMIEYQKAAGFAPKPLPITPKTPASHLTE